MRRARTEWGVGSVVVLFLLSALLASCSLLEGTGETPQPQPAVSEDDSQPEATAPTENVGGSPAQVDGQKPEKPPGPPDDAEQEVTPTPTPGAAQDAAQDAWTILVYMSASETLDGAAMQALQAMRAVEKEGINVVVQLDRSAAPQREDGWQGARRLAVTDDGGVDPGSQFIEELGATNMGDPDSLTDFVQWGREQFPATHTALVLWGEGRGWRGIVQDAGNEDDLSLGDLGGALERVQDAQREGPGLDVLALAGSMTASLEVLRVVQPYAAFAVGSPGLLPPESWDFASLLAAIEAEPQPTPRRLAQLMVTAGLPQTRGERTIESGLTAVELSRLTAVEEAYADLARFLVQQADVSVATVSAARHGSQIMTLDGGGREGLSTAVDVGAFARYLAEWSSLPALAQRGEQVLEATVQLVIDTSVAEEPGSGISVAFLPRTDTGEPDGYAQAAPESWAEAVQAFYEAAAALTPAPRGQVAVQQGERVGAEDPVLLGLQLRALHLQGASFAGLLPGEGGSARLLFVDKLAPDEAWGALPGVWPDGVTQRELIWNTTAPYVSDGAIGAFAPLWQVAANEERALVLARYVPAEEADMSADAPGGASREVVLVFDRTAQELAQIWQVGQQGQAARLLAPANGAGLQLTDFFVDGAEQIRYEPGETLVYSDGLEIRYDMFPLPSGEYQVGLLGEDATGDALAAASDLTVTNEALTPGYQTYLNVTHGFQFQYPVDWPEPVFDGRQVATAARQRGPGLTVSLYPAAGRLTAAGLKQETLESFGAVDILHEEEVTAGGLNALLTAYGYDAGDGPHTGVLATFVNSEQEMGYVVDVDGLALDEARTLEIADHLLDSWRFTPIRAGVWPAQWITTPLGTLAVTLPPEYGHETLENGWELFKDGARFLALRADTVSGWARSAISRHWLDVASRGVSGFSAGEERRLVLGGTVWSLFNFDYEGEEGAISGVILSTIYGGQEISAWAEGPEEAMGALWNEQYIFAVAGALQAEPGLSGLMFEERFEEAGAWGVGRQDGAAGAVQDGVYELAVDAERGFFWTAGGVNLGQGQFEVDVTQTMGPVDAGYGLLIRADSEAQSFYVFEVSSDGYAWIGWCEDNCATAATLAGEGWLTTEAMAEGLNAKNRLRVEADGAEMTFYVNDVLVGSVEDDRATQGEIGLFVETLGEGGVVVQFDDLRVLAP